MPTLEIPVKSGIRGRMRTAPKSAGNTHRSLTRSLDLTKEGLAMNATRIEKPYPMDAASLAKFMAKVHITDSGCWEWTGYRNHKGYPYFHHGKTGQAHRMSHKHFVGPIPDGYDVDHLCRNRACVNPEHLEAVTHQENLHRSMESRGHEQARTHCPQGHEYTPENTFERRPGSRACEECRTAYRVKARLRNKTCPECGAVVRARGIARHRKLHLRAEQTGANRAE